MKIVPRSEWGAVYGTGDKGLARPAPRVVIHHTYRPDLVHGLSLESVAIHVRAIEEYHVRTKGWSGIGYNWLIDQDGRVYEGRGWGRHGAHAAGVNSVSIGIAFMVDGSARTPTESAWRSAEWLIRYGVRAGEIAPGYTLTGHRDHGNTDCPGDMIYEAMDRLRDLSPDPVPEIAVPDRGPGTDDTLRLEKVDVPTREHVDAIVRAWRVDPAVVATGISVAETLLRGIAAGNLRERVAGAAADALADWLEDKGL